MENFMDALWFKIVDLVEMTAAGLDLLFEPLHVLGPAAAISAIALAAVCVSKLLDWALPHTRRQRELEAEFNRLYRLRQEALDCGDPEKGKYLARNIDQAEMNGVYYNLFFEKLMRNLMTTYLPIFSFLAYVNEAYSPAALTAKFGISSVMTLPSLSGEAVAAGGVFWYLASVVAIFILWFAGGLLYGKMRRKNDAPEKRHSGPGPLTRQTASGSIG
jgi:hypothetical protein